MILANRCGMYCREATFDTGAKSLGRIRGYVSTTRKHRINAFEAILSAAIGSLWMPPLPTT